MYRTSSVTSEISAAALIRETACCFTARECREIHLRSVWAALASGASLPTDQFSSPDRHYIVLEARPAGTSALPVAQANLDVLISFLCGSSQKELMYARGVSAATITAGLAGTLSKMGFRMLPSRVPMVLAMAAWAHAAGTTGCNFGARCTTLPNAGGLEVISVERPELSLKRILTPVEFDVARLVVEGNTHRQIAALRRTAIRTVANQVASAYRKLNVSGRGELVRFLLVNAEKIPGSLVRSE